MDQKEILEIFKKSNALLEGHFLLTSGRHSDRYMQCAQVLRFPEYTEKLCSVIANEYKDAGVELVIGPAMGGILVAYEVARQLGVPNIFAERENGRCYGRSQDIRSSYRAPRDHDGQFHDRRLGAHPV